MEYLYIWNTCMPEDIVTAPSVSLSLPFSSVAIVSVSLLFPLSKVELINSGTHRNLNTTGK